MDFKADNDIVDALVHLKNKSGVGSVGEQPQMSRPWGRRCGACITLTMPDSSCNRPQKRRKMMDVMVVMCAAWRPRLNNVLTHEGDAGGHRHLQHRGSRPGVQPTERVRLPRGERQP